MIWLRPRNVIAAVVVVALVAAALFALLRPDPPDPRLAWTASADDACGTFSLELTGYGPPTNPADPAVVAEWTPGALAVYDALIAELEAIPTPDDATGELATEVVTSFTARRAAVAGMGSTADAEQLGESNATLEESFVEVAELLEPFGAEVCNQPITPTTGPVMEEVPAEVWLEAASAACSEAVTRFAAADEAFADDRTDLAGYLADVSAYATQLSSQLQSLPGEVPVTVVDVLPELIASIDDAAAAAATGDVAATSAAGDRWIAAATTADIGPCAQGIAANVDGPTANLFAEPLVPAPSEGSGVAADGAIVDAAAAARLFANSMVSGGSSDAATAFGAARVFAALSPQVVVVDGASTPAPGQVSVSAPVNRVLNETFGTSGDVVGIAVTDSSGRCATARFWSEGGRPVGFAEVAAAACTGDAARDGTDVG
jgi:hypothetical protein